MQVRSDDVSWQELDGHVVVLDLRSSVYLEINASGTVLWNLLVGGAEVDDLQVALVERYGLTSSDAAHDVARFLETMRMRDLLEG